jgi:hypothetical protein
MAKNHKPKTPKAKASPKAEPPLTEAEITGAVKEALLEGRLPLGTMHTDGTLEVNPLLKAAGEPRAAAELRSQQLAKHLADVVDDEFSKMPKVITAADDAAARNVVSENWATEIHALAILLHAELEPLTSFEPEQIESLPPSSQHLVRATAAALDTYRALRAQEGKF